MASEEVFDAMLSDEVYVHHQPADEPAHVTPPLPEPSSSDADAKPIGILENDSPATVSEAEIPPPVEIEPVSLSSEREDASTLPDALPPRSDWQTEAIAVHEPLASYEEIDCEEDEAAELNDAPPSYIGPPSADLNAIQQAEVDHLTQQSSLSPSSAAGEEDAATLMSPAPTQPDEVPVAPVQQQHPAEVEKSALPAVGGLAVVQKNSVLWANPKDTSHCPSCGSKFTLFHRKHHCRHCGLIYCGKCSSETVLGQGAEAQKLRLCESCKTQLASAAQSSAVSGSSAMLQEAHTAAEDQKAHLEGVMDILVRLQRTQWTDVSAEKESLLREAVETGDARCCLAASQAIATTMTCVDPSQLVDYPDFLEALAILSNRPNPKTQSAARSAMTSLFLHSPASAKALSAVGHAKTYAVLWIMLGASALDQQEVALSSLNELVPSVTPQTLATCYNEKDIALLVKRMSSHSAGVAVLSTRLLAILALHSPVIYRLVVEKDKYLSTFVKLYHESQHQEQKAEVIALLQGLAAPGLCASWTAPESGSSSNLSLEGMELPPSSPALLPAPWNVKRCLIMLGSRDATVMQYALLALRSQQAHMNQGAVNEQNATAEKEMLKNQVARSIVDLCNGEDSNIHIPRETLLFALSLLNSMLASPTMSYQVSESLLSAKVPGYGAFYRLIAPEASLTTRKEIMTFLTKLSDATNRSFGQQAHSVLAGYWPTLQAWLMEEECSEMALVLFVSLARHNNNHVWLAGAVAAYVSLLRMDLPIRQAATLQLCTGLADTMEARHLLICGDMIPALSSFSTHADEMIRRAAVGLLYNLLATPLVMDTDVNYVNAMKLIVPWLTESELLLLVTMEDMYLSYFALNIYGALVHGTLLVGSLSQERLKSVPSLKVSSSAFFESEEEGGEDKEGEQKPKVTIAPAVSASDASTQLAALVLRMAAEEKLHQVIRTSIVQGKNVAVAQVAAHTAVGMAMYAPADMFDHNAMEIFAELLQFKEIRPRQSAAALLLFLLQGGERSSEILRVLIEDPEMLRTFVALPEDVTATDEAVSYVLELLGLEGDAGLQALKALPLGTILVQMGRYGSLAAQHHVAALLLQLTDMSAWRSLFLESEVLIMLAELSNKNEKTDACVVARKAVFGFVEGGIDDLSMQIASALLHSVVEETYLPAVTLLLSLLTEKKEEPSKECRNAIVFALMRENIPADVGEKLLSCLDALDLLPVVFAKECLVDTLLKFAVEDSYSDALKLHALKLLSGVKDNDDVIQRISDAGGCRALVTILQGSNQDLHRVVFSILVALVERDTTSRSMATVDKDLWETIRAYLDVLSEHGAESTLLVTVLRLCRSLFSTVQGQDAAAEAGVEVALVKLLNAHVESRQDVLQTVVASVALSSKATEHLFLADVLTCIVPWLEACRENNNELLLLTLFQVFTALAALEAAGEAMLRRGCIPSLCALGQGQSDRELSLVTLLVRLATPLQNRYLLVAAKPIETLTILVGASRSNLVRGQAAECLCLLSDSCPEDVSAQLSQDGREKILTLTEAQDASLVAQGVRIASSVSRGTDGHEFLEQIVHRASHLLREGSADAVCLEAARALRLMAVIDDKSAGTESDPGLPFIGENSLEYLLTMLNRPPEVAEESVAACLAILSPPARAQKRLKQVTVPVLLAFLGGRLESVKSAEEDSHVDHAEIARIQLDATAVVTELAEHPQGAFPTLQNSVHLQQQGVVALKALIRKLNDLAAKRQGTVTLSAQQQRAVCVSIKLLCQTNLANLTTADDVRSIALLLVAPVIDTLSVKLELMLALCGLVRTSPGYVVLINDREAIQAVLDALSVKRSSEFAAAAMAVFAALMDKKHAKDKLNQLGLGELLLTWVESSDENSRSHAVQLLLLLLEKNEKHSEKIAANPGFKHLAPVVRSCTQRGVQANAVQLVGIFAKREYNMQYLFSSEVMEALATLAHEGDTHRHSKAKDSPERVALQLYTQIYKQYKKKPDWKGPLDALNEKYQLDVGQ
jgi:hypothetical protein